MNILPCNNPVNSQAFENFVIHIHKKTREKYIWIITRTVYGRRVNWKRKRKARDTWEWETGTNSEERK